MLHTFLLCTVRGEADNWCVPLSGNSFALTDSAFNRATADYSSMYTRYTASVGNLATGIIKCAKYVGFCLFWGYFFVSLLVVCLF